MFASSAEASSPGPQPPARLSPTEAEHGLSRADQDHLGRRLRTMYDALAADPLPDHLQGLLAQLSRQEPE